MQSPGLLTFFSMARQITFLSLPFNPSSAFYQILRTFHVLRNKRIFALKNMVILILPIIRYLTRVSRFFSASDDFNEPSIAGFSTELFFVAEPRVALNNKFQWIQLPLFSIDALYRTESDQVYLHIYYTYFLHDSNPFFILF